MTIEGHPHTQKAEVKFLEEARKFLDAAFRELSIKDEEIRRLGLGDRFMTKEYRLHVRCFYDGEYTVDDIREELEKSKQYINDIAELV